MWERAARWSTQLRRECWVATGLSRWNRCSDPQGSVCFMVNLVCLFMKTQLLALLQDNCLDLVCCDFLHKLSGCVRNITAFCQHLLRPSAVLVNIYIQVKPKFRLGRYIGLSLFESCCSGMHYMFSSMCILCVWHKNHLHQLWNVAYTCSHCPACFRLQCSCEHVLVWKLSCEFPWDLKNLFCSARPISNKAAV